MKYTSLLLLFTLLLGCTTAPTVKSWLDPVSSATVTTQTEPLILARDSQARASDEREFTQLTALEINRMGERRLYLVVVPWSSEQRPRTERAEFEQSFARVELRMGDRSTTLARYRGDIAELGVGQSPLPLPIPGSQQWFFPIERVELNALASSSRLQLIALGDPDAPRRYDEWQDGRLSLSAFLDQLPNESTNSSR